MSFLYILMLFKESSIDQLPYASIFLKYINVILCLNTQKKFEGLMLIDLVRHYILNEHLSKYFK